MSTRVWSTLSVDVPATGTEMPPMLGRQKRAQGQVEAPSLVRMSARTLAASAWPFISFMT
jgi:hypothetical protein